MKSLTLLALEIYDKVNKRYNSTEENSPVTKQHLLNEVTQWTVEEIDIGNGSYEFIPKEFDGEPDSPDFTVKLRYDTDKGYHELKFGNLSALDIKDRYLWIENDPYRLQKSLFLFKALQKVVKLLESGKVKQVVFSPYFDDGHGNDRMSYFKNMYKKLDTSKFEFKYDKQLNLYIVTK